MMRILIAVAAMLAAGFVMSVGQAQMKIPVPQVPRRGPDGVDPKMPYFQVCSKQCDDCARVCDTCSAHCTTMIADGKKEHVATLKLCQDCASICAVASRIVAKDGPMSDLICTACADACKRCGDACEKQSGDPIMKSCSEECRKCEKTCREMLKAGTGTSLTKPGEEK
jgi:hypothetical protein